MITLRRAEERFHSSFGWLDSWHSFSFGDHYDPAHVGFRVLRVINDDRIAAGQGFGTHPHRDMEIVTYLVAGAIEHKDSMGNGSIVRAGEVQRMTAGTGVLHSERNPLPDEETHLLQIWLLPERRGLKPSYEQRSFPLESRKGRLTLLASRDGREGSVTVHQDVALYSALLSEGDAVSYPMRQGRYAWVQMVRGAASLNGVELKAGDGAAVSGESKLELVGRSSSDVLLFDLP